MAKTCFSLRIHTKEENYKKASEILKRDLLDWSRGWIHEVDNSQQDEYYDFINIFLDILEGHYEELESIGIARDNISIWMIYEYNQQCNMEFLPKDMKRLGDNKITLCISCYQVGG